MEPFDKERSKRQDAYSGKTKTWLKERPNSDVHGVICASLVLFLVTTKAIYSHKKSCVLPSDTVYGIRASGPALARTPSPITTARPTFFFVGRLSFHRINAGRMPNTQSIMVDNAEDASVESTAISDLHLTCSPAMRVQNPRIGLHWKIVKKK